MYGEPGLKPWQSTKWVPPVSFSVLLDHHRADLQGFTSRKTEMEHGKIAARRFTEHDENVGSRPDSEETMRENGLNATRPKKSAIHV